MIFRAQINKDYNKIIYNYLFFFYMYNFNN